MAVNVLQSLKLRFPLPTGYSNGFSPYFFGYKWLLPPAIQVHLVSPSTRPDLSFL